MGHKWHVISAIPAAISVIIGQVVVIEKKKPIRASTDQNRLEQEDKSTDDYRGKKKQRGFLQGIRTFDSRLKFFIVISSVFAFANFNLSFFILRAKAHRNK